MRYAGIQIADSYTLDKPTGSIRLGVLLLSICVLIVGCQSNGQASKEIDRQDFDIAGPSTPMLDVTKIELASRPTGEYQLVPGDIVELYMPEILSTIKDDLLVAEGRQGFHLTRVESSGKLVVPLIGLVDAEGKTIQALEGDLKSLYHPKFVKIVPSIVGKVTTFQTHPVKIIGAVDVPGVYLLKHDEMSIVSVLTKAGGISEGGAGAIRISHADQTVPDNTVILPVKHLDIPFVDIALLPGDLVEVQRLSPRSISVVGLVNRPGVYVYPPETQYNLLQALALAGGLNADADPHHARVYRRDRDGQLVWNEFQVSGSHGAEGADVILKPGDVVAVQQTFYTSTRTFIAQVFRVGFGFDLNR